MSNVKIIFYFLICILASGCSVGLALKQDSAPDTSIIALGANRSDIEKQLGHPVHIETLPQGGSFKTYAFMIGDKRSTRRAVAHGVMDVTTLGLWELIGTPLESSRSKRVVLQIEYDQNDRVVQIRKITPRAAMGPERSLL